MNDPVYAINEALCIECGQCRRYCPLAGAIVIDERYQHVVIEDKCSGCGLCEAFCPVPGAIVVKPRESKTTRERLKILRRVVWRGTWSYHEHPLMGAVTHAARQHLRAYRRSERQQRYAFASR
jgi:MinD superfamily P-loop ATPase